MRIPALLLLALALGLGSLTAPAAADDAELANWREQLDRAESRLSQAQDRADAAEYAYVNMRHDRSVRGTDKAKVLAERSDAQRELAEAKENLATVREEARRAGAPPQWVLPDPMEDPEAEPPADL